MLQLQACWLRISQGLGLASLRRDRRGVTALEYGMIATLIAVAILVSLTTIGTKLGSTFTLLATKV